MYDEFLLATMAPLGPTLLRSGAAEGFAACWEVEVDCW